MPVHPSYISIFKAKCKKTVPVGPLAKNSTESLKNSTDVSALSACFSNYGGPKVRPRAFQGPRPILGPRGDYLMTINRAYLCPVCSIWPFLNDVKIARDGGRVK